MVDSTGIAAAAEPASVADIVEVVWLPALLGVVTAAATWLIWYYTHTVCTLEIAGLTGCNLGSVAKYVNVDVFGRMLTYGGLVGGIGGFWRYDMIRKERAARIAAQMQVAELQKQLEEARAKNAAIREEERLQATEERRLAAEERRQERQAFLAALTELTAEIAHMRQQRNGGSHNGQ